MIAAAAATQRAVASSVAPRASSLRRSINSIKPSQSRRGNSTTVKASENDLMEQLMAMLGGGAKGQLVDAKDALPGRQQEMRVVGLYKEPVDPELTVGTFHHVFMTASI
jgi:hypothetical protein